MLLFTAAALAGMNLGYPCSRLNWAWRNVWSTCSINSYVPTDAAGDDRIPAHWRKYPVNDADDTDFGAPTNILGANGVMAPVANTNVPKLLCDALGTTTGGSGPYAAMRNRCRRAIDAYGGLVRMCRLAPDVATPGMFRGPVDHPAAGTNLLDWEPGSDHAPHALNINALNTHARWCTESDFPGTFRSPGTTCPGLLGWFTVVWHACSFDTNGPHLVGDMRELVPLGSTVVKAKIFYDDTPLQDSPQAAGVPDFIFCSPAGGAASPKNWFYRDNTGAPNAVRPFRSSRCRKALDQLGRTASRCGVLGRRHTDYAPYTGWNDALLSFLAGQSTGDDGTGATVPMGFLNLAPLCN